jgi:multisubunit Na+/H+ antiporter MnhB subunit
MAHGSTHRGDMNIHEQRSTYDLFMGMTKWGSLAVATLVLFLVVWFCVGPDGGLATALISALALVLAGFFVLKSKTKTKTAKP